MAYFNTDELLAAALAQLGREQGGIASGPYKGGASMEEIGTYTGGAEVVPLELAVGRRGFSSPKADKQWEIDKYFENIRRLREKGILPTPKAEADDSYLEDAMLAGAPRYIKYGGPPNSIIKAPHVDSPLVDKWLDDYRLRDTLRGPQLPGFV